MTATIQFFIGKGGVGKSTTSAIAALGLSRSGRNTLLVSMDPAHNQRDIFKQRFSENPEQVRSNLFVKEVDVDYWIATYLKDAENQLKKAYRYQTAFNLHSYYKILKYSPGLEEYALLLAFENVLSTSPETDEILFDMPPTALTLRFFSLPFVTLIWLGELLKLRDRIFAKKEIVSKIKFGKKDIEQDHVKAKLASLIQRHTNLKELFLADRTHINLVLNEDGLSISEAHRINQKLSEMRIHTSRIIVNKVKSRVVGERIRNEFNGFPLSAFPEHTGELYGLPALEGYLRANFREFVSGSDAPFHRNRVDPPGVSMQGRQGVRYEPE